MINNILFIYYICIGIGIGIVLFKNNFFYLVLGTEIVINSIGAFLLIGASYFQSTALFIFLLFLYIIAAYEVALLFIIFYADRKIHDEVALSYYSRIKEDG